MAATNAAAVVDLRSLTGRVGRDRGGLAAALVGLLLVVAEAVTAAAGAPQPVLALTVLAVAPGLALLPVVPLELRRPSIGLCVIGPLSLALTVVAFVSLAAAGIPLTAWSIRVSMLVLTTAGVGMGLVAAPRERTDQPTAPSLAERQAVVLVLAVVVLAVALQSQVLSVHPLLGRDWGHYLSYADAVRHQHGLRAHNPYWMLGAPFLDDPGVPSLYGGYLLLNGQAATTAAHGIWIFAVFAVLAVYVLAATLWGRLEGILAAALYASIATNLDLLAWYGAANQLALVFAPLVLLGAGIALRGCGSVRWAWLWAVAIAALAAAHALSFGIVGFAAALATLAAVLRKRRNSIAFLLPTAGFLLVFGAGVTANRRYLASAGGGVQSYRAYLSTKLDWTAVAHDIPVALIVAGVAAVGWLAVQSRRGDHSRLLPAALLVAILAFGYAWLVHVPLAYSRVTYYLPLAFAPAIAVALTRRPRAGGILVALALLALTVSQTISGAANLRRFYTVDDAASERGIAHLAKIAPRASVVADSCWAFLAPWLLHAPTLAALDPSQIEPRSEVAPAAAARMILAGGRRGAAEARRLGIRYALIDPLCTGASGRLPTPPAGAKPLYLSTHLVVLDLEPHR